MRRSHESGSVLVLALLVTLVILALGLVAMWLSSSSMKMSGNITRRQEALYASEAGLERARVILQSQTDWALLAAGCTTGPPNDPGDPAAGHKGYLLCEPTTSTALLNISLLNSSTFTGGQAPGSGNIAYTVFIRNDDAEIASGSTTSGYNTDGDRRVVIRAEGTGRDGLSFFAIETVLSQASASAEEENYSQLGGSAQNQNSDEGSLPLP